MSHKAAPYREPTDGSVVGTVTELFAGVGGFRIGLARAGWKTLYSNQWEPSSRAQHASRIYVHRFGSVGHTNTDITELVNEMRVTGKRIIPKTDLLVGGFPCQDYSVAKTLGSAKGLEGKKGVLWWEIREIVARNKPRLVFLENVDRLLKSPADQRGRDFAVMLKTLGMLGYQVEWRVVNAADYGFPQRRIRVLIVAKRTSATSVLDDNAARTLMLSEGILARALPVVDPGSEPTRVDLLAPPEVISSTFARDRGVSPFLSCGVYRAGLAWTAMAEPVRPKTRLVLGDVLLPDAAVPDRFWVPKGQLEDWRYLKGAKTIQRHHKGTGTPYQYAEGKMAFPDLESNPSRTILTGEGGASPSRFKHIVERPKGFRRLMPVELERLNGFPDEWTATDGSSSIPDTRRAFLMGNALVVGLVEMVGHSLADEVKNFYRARQRAQNPHRVRRTNQDGKARQIH